MELIGKYKNSGFEAVADGVISFFDRREDLHTNGIAFGQSTSLNSEPYKVSTDTVSYTHLTLPTTPYV